MSRKEIVHERPACTDPGRCGVPIIRAEDITFRRGMFESVITTKAPSMNEHSLDAGALGYGSTKDTVNDRLCLAQLNRGGIRENDEPKASSRGAADSSMFRGK